MRSLVAAFVVASASCAVAQSQPSPPPSKLTSALVERADIRAALAFVDAHFDQQVAEWIRLTEIPAPSGQEAARAAVVRTELEKLGLTVTSDTIGNLTAVRKGRGDGPTIVFAA